MSWETDPAPVEGKKEAVKTWPKSKKKVKKKAKKPVKSRRKKSVVPRKQKKASVPLKLTPRQLKYKQNRLAGMSIFSAAKAAGYSHSYARGTATRLLEKVVAPTIIEELEMAGLTNQAQARELARIAFSATKTEKCKIYRENEEGDIEVESEGTQVPDETARLKALEQIGKLKKQISAPFEKTLLGQDYTRLTIVVEKDPDEVTDEGNQDNIDSKTRLSVATPN